MRGFIIYAHRWPYEFLCISEGCCKNLWEIFKSLALFALFHWLPIEGVEKYLDFSARLQIYRLFAGYQLRGYIKALVCYENKFCKQTVKDYYLRWSAPRNFPLDKWGDKILFGKIQSHCPFCAFSPATTWGDSVVIRNLNTTPIMYSAYLITAPTNYRSLTIE